MQFANPWGFLALLGIPAVLFIHALRRNPKTFLTNTLFLIEAKLRDPGGGRRLRRLRRSAQLWLRLLLVAVIAWLLAQPVTVREDSTQRVVLVLDTSASMAASKDALAPALRAAAKPWIDQTAHIEWIVLNSVADVPPVYRGWDNFDAVVTAIDKFDFLERNHDPRTTLNLALGLASAHGRVVFLTDNVPETELPGVGVLAIGSPVQNVGWCGVDVSPDGSWKAILRNYGDARQSRTLTDADGSQRKIMLEPGEWREMTGSIAAPDPRATISLAPDRFELDDTLYLIRQRRKSLAWVSKDLPSSLQRLFAASGLEKAVADDDIDIEVRGNDFAPAEFDHARILIPDKPSQNAPYVKVPATGSRHDLTEGLVFDGLLWRKCAPLNPADSSDAVLLWAGKDPVAILRDSGRTLELGFHPDFSNLHRVPSALVLVQRWLDSIREKKVASESRQLATGDRLQIAADPEGAQLNLATADQTKSIRAAAQTNISAPNRPGYFSVSQGDDVILLEAGTNFVDPIESDFAKADAGFTPAPEPETLLRAAQSPDRFRDLWLLLAIALLLLTWAFPETAGIRGRPTAAQPTS